MHINGSASLSEPKRGTGMIEMNMTQKNVADIGRFDPEFFQAINHGVKRRLRTGIE